MTTARTSTDVITEGISEAHGIALDALRDAVARNAELWRRIDTPNAPVPGLSWTAAETAAHVVGDLRDCIEALSRHANGYITHAQRPAESPSRLSALANARHLELVPQRDMHVLAELLEKTAETYLVAAEAAEPQASIPIANGLVLPPPTLSCVLLGEQLVHGLDIARAAGARWPISRGDALLVIPAMLALGTHYIRPNQRDVRASFELRMRGGPRYRMAVSEGTAVVTAAVEQSDCVITADPVTFLLMGFGRVSQLTPVIRRRIRAGGRKPWLALKFGTLMSAP
jgi:Mycothiol maleylpyruvate isomerase N-terminal domain